MLASGAVFPQCQSKVCEAYEVCDFTDGKESCVTGFGSYCWIVGDPHYKTFDGIQYDFEGACVYTISKSTNLEDGLIPFNIEAKNENRGNSQVSFVGVVKLYIYEDQIAAFRDEKGFVQVNNQTCQLPLFLNENVIILHSGLFLYIHTDFLKLFYDWDSILIIQLSKKYSEKVEGMCGSYKLFQSPEEQMQHARPLSQLEAAALGKSFATQDSDSQCRHDCHGKCTKCSEKERREYETSNNCGIILKKKGPFSGCHSVVDPYIFFEYCVNDQCLNNGSRHMLCHILRSYVAVCQRNRAKIGQWRRMTACPLSCPENSAYKLCGKACPKTCNDDVIKPVCSEPCVETCECKKGYVTDGGQCIPKAMCGCVVNGHVYSPYETYWDDPNCTKRCKCDPDTRTIICFEETCKENEMCVVVRGIQTCQSFSNGTCSAYGDPHFRSFDKLNYDFQGICVYLFSGLWKNGTGLNDFQIYIQNKNRGKRAVSYVHTVKVLVYEHEIILNSDYLHKVQVNGYLINFPFTSGLQDLSIFKAGADAVIETKFGLKVLFSWKGHLVVTVPGVYAGTLGGLCGNFDGNQKNDFMTPDHVIVSNSDVFGRSWTVEYPSGCNQTHVTLCPNLKNITEQHRTMRDGCGILLDKNGPFRMCHAKVNPENLFNNCAMDACYYHGRLDVICEVITTYGTICQAYGATIDPWRSAMFCDVQCPPNSHYVLCASPCQSTCASFAPPLGCTPGCAKGCVCDDGYILSGEECVTLDQCGCKYQGQYYKLEETFISKECDQICECISAENIQCTFFSCEPNERCGTANGHPACVPKEPGQAMCLISGNSHYMTFDGVTYDFEGNCAYILSATTIENPRLQPFAIYIHNERSGKECLALSKSVSLEIYGYTMELQHKREGVILVNGVLYNLPFKLPDGKIDAYPHGMKSVIVTDVGIKVSYDLLYNIIVTIPNTYQGAVGGLCGNYNDNSHDEFLLPDQKTATNNSTFGHSWSIEPPYWDISENCGNHTHVCPPCNSQMKELLKTEKYCGFLNKPNGPLRDCHEKIKPNNYFINCKKDLCDIESDDERKELLCQIIHSYVLACQAVRANVLVWRNDSFCSLQCPEYSRYSICAKVCSASCRTLVDPGQCPATCAEGCECYDDYFFDGQSCVPMDNCGCYVNGKYYKDGQYFLKKNCTQQCSCRSGYVFCQSMKCKPNEECIIFNEALVCQKTIWECSINLENYITYENQSGSGLLSGAYDVSFVCDSWSISWFRIVADIYNCESEPSAVSRVHIFTHGTVVTISKDGKIWVRGQRLQDEMLSDHTKLSSDTSMSKGKDGIEIYVGEHLELLFSVRGILRLKTREFYIGSLCGLCGNTNWMILDDSVDSNFKSVLQNKGSNSWIAEDFVQRHSPLAIAFSGSGLFDANFRSEEALYTLRIIYAGKRS
ncbi:IgGFc-binding protein-like [Pyxicephalus adspersus]|uniref:IgGFc-binding protein-like n=1 Tax=Pyxicephalus adspersus TaxID=30357 RepID=UPI003B591CCA